VELPAAECSGVVFVRCRPGDPIDLDAFLGTELVEELAMFDFAHWSVFLDTHVHRVAANWKVTIDTFRENYHIDHLHRDTLSHLVCGGILAFDSFGPHTRNCSAQRSIEQLRGAPEDQWEPLDHLASQYGIFPSTTLAVTNVRAEFWQIFPGSSIDETVVWHTGLVPPWHAMSDDERTRLADVVQWTCETVVDGQDFRLAERSTAGLRSLDTIVLGRNEPAPQHIHRAYATALNAADDRRLPAEAP
jgi:phenylpropionate dioxygenase-like ring-hydroxylating dioxygenase large terminal subunit